MNTQTFKNNIHDNARVGIINGIDRIAKTVGSTMGAAGSNSVIEEDINPGFQIINDGYTILDRAQFEDPLEEIGRRILFDAVSRANKQSGDGSTTTCVLTSAILAEGMKTGLTGMQIKNSLDAHLLEIENLIDEQKKDITVDEVEAVATISAESQEIGKLLASIYKEIGKDGIIELDNSKTFQTTYEIKEGVRFGAGVLSPYFFNKEHKAEYEKPAVLVVRRIQTIHQITPIIEKVSSSGKKEIVIMVDDISDAVTGRLVTNHLKGNFNILIIKAPTVWKDFIMEDFAKATGATMIEKTMRLEDIDMGHLGTCGKILVTRDETTILGIADISAHIDRLKELGDDDSVRRVCWLGTKAAVLKLGASSDAELSYKRFKAEDAINASRLALQSGIVPGGGVALLNAAKRMPDTLGGKILREALKSPIRQIIANIGNPAIDIDILPMTMNSQGFDANTGAIVDMFEAKIVDPATVVKNAIRSAISVAGTALTIKTGITLNRTEEEIAMNVIKRKQAQF